MHFTHRFLSSTARLAQLLGRADVAELADRKATPERDARAEAFSGSVSSTPGFEKDSRASGAVYVDLDLALYKLSPLLSLCEERRRKYEKVRKQP